MKYWHQLCHNNRKIKLVNKINRFRFISDDSVTRRGFQIEYNAIDIFQECGGSFSNSSGILTSPSHPNQYQGMEDCVYLIAQPNGTSVNISFITMDINCSGIPPDYIEMRDGDSEDSPLMGKFCGNGSHAPDSMQTTQNQLRIRWDRKQLDRKTFPD